MEQGGKGEGTGKQILTSHAPGNRLNLQWMKGIYESPEHGQGSWDAQLAQKDQKEADIDSM